MASWLRTGYGAIGIGLAFQALFNKVEPGWVPRLIATGFLATAILMFVSAERRASAVFDRLDEHRVVSVNMQTLRLVVAISVLACVAMMIVIWKSRVLEIL